MGLDADGSQCTGPLTLQGLGHAVVGHVQGLQDAARAAERNGCHGQQQVFGLDRGCAPRGCLVLRLQQESSDLFPEPLAPQQLVKHGCLASW